MTDPVNQTKPAAGAIPAPNELARCVVLMSRDKTPQAAEILIPATNQTLAHSVQLRSKGDENRLEGSAKDGKGADVGTLTVNRNPKSEDNSQSLRPVTCEAGGTTYPVVIPDNVEKRLFSPSAPKIS